MVTTARLQKHTHAYGSKRAHINTILFLPAPPPGAGFVIESGGGRERRKKAQRMHHQVRCVRYDAEEHNRWESWPGSPTEALEGANKDSYADITPFIRDLTDCREFTLDQKKKTNKRNRSL